MSVNKDKSTWRLTTPGGIKVKVKERSGSFEREAANAQEVYIMRSEDLTLFLLESFPIPYTFLNIVFYPSVRRMPSFPVMQSVRISWKALTDGRPVDPFGSDPSAPDNTYDENLEVTIDYSTNNGTGGSNDEDPDPNNPLTFLEVSVSSGGNFIYTPSRGSLKWEGADINLIDPFTGLTYLFDEPDTEIKDRDVPVTVNAPETEWTIRWSQIPYGFFNATLAVRLRGMIGRVNSEPMPVFFNAPAETILFLGWTLRQQFSWRSGLAGQPPIEVELKFAEKNFIAQDGVQVTHNHFYRSSGSDVVAGPPIVDATYPGWRKVIVVTGTGNKSVYEAVDLNDIFKP